MKLIKSNITKLFILLGIAATIGFTIYQSTLVQEEKQLILGTWGINGDETSKMIFTSDGICKWEFEGAISDTFTYTIGSEFSPNGHELTYLELIDVSDATIVFEYSIDSLDDEKMRLEHAGGFGDKFSEYTKE